MRHPLSTTRSGGESEGAVAVGDVSAFVVPDLLAQAVPEDLQPAVAERAQGGVVPFTGADFPVVELAGPGALTKVAVSTFSGPTVTGRIRVVVATDPRT